MKIAVCIKQVPDTETKIVLNGEKTGIQADNIKYVMGPYDEFAVEEALRIKEKLGGETFVLSFGPKRVQESLRTAMAMGIDNAIHILKEDFDKADNYSGALALSNTLKTISPDLVLCGKMAVDDGAGVTPQMISDFLNMPSVTVVSKIEMGGDQKSAKVTRDIDGGAKEIYDVQLPALFSLTKGINEPRYASLPGIMKAKKKTIAEMTPESVGFASDKVKVTFSNFSLPAARVAGKKIDGEPEDVADKLTNFLRNEAKVL